jgi:transcription elongation factor GreA
MIDNKRIYLTKAKYLTYSEQLAYLKTKGEAKLAKLLSESPSSGMGRPMDLPIHDLARRFFKERDELSAKLNRMEIIDEYVNNLTDISLVDLGAKVAIENIDDNEKEEYFILGPDEANPHEGRISFQSPLAVALLGRKVGEIVSIKSAESHFRITKIEYLPLNFVYEPKDWDKELDSVGT